jgi:Cu/Zn superoxide dismutase
VLLLQTSALQSAGPPSTGGHIVMSIDDGSGQPTSLFKDGGTAFVFHANPDDEKTDPSGNSGGRIACVVIQK